MMFCEGGGRLRGYGADLRAKGIAALLGLSTKAVEAALHRLRSVMSD